MRGNISLAEWPYEIRYLNPRKQLYVHAYKPYHIDKDNQRVRYNNGYNTKVRDLETSTAHVTIVYAMYNMKNMKQENP
jgi:hypothetical protein